MIKTAIGLFVIGVTGFYIVRKIFHSNEDKKAHKKLIRNQELDGEDIYRLYYMDNLAGKAYLIQELEIRYFSSGRNDAENLLWEISAYPFPRSLLFDLRLHLNALSTI